MLDGVVFGIGLSFKDPSVAIPHMFVGIVRRATILSTFPTPVSIAIRARHVIATTDLGSGNGAARTVFGDKMNILSGVAAGFAFELRNRRKLISTCTSTNISRLKARGTPSIDAIRV